MKKISIVVGLCMMVSLMCLSASAGQPWWKKWPSHPPNVPRITAKEVKNLMLSGEKIVFVYTGYKVKKVVCGSLIIPYTLVPPRSDGSRVRLRVPKNYWIMCY